MLCIINAEPLTALNTADGEKKYFRRLSTWPPEELVFKVLLITHRIV
jgi:hypothetical protein